ncbi:MAG: hypothetical protein U0133_11610 [Gemmatimonadales bacterium]
MRSSRPESPLSETARDYKGATRVLTWFSVLLGAGVLAAVKGWIPRPFGPFFTGLFTASALSTIWMGSKAHKRALEDREKEGSRFMIIAIAAQLAKQDDEALERIKAKGGPAGEAAAMILVGRSEKRTRAESRKSNT